MGGGGGGGGGVFLSWVFGSEIFKLNPLSFALQVTSTVAYSVKELG